MKVNVLIRLCLLFTNKFSKESGAEDKMKEKIKRFLIAYVRFVNDFVDAVSFQRSSKRVTQIAICIVLALAAFITAKWNLFLNPATDFWGWKVMATAYGFALMIGVLMVFRVHVEERFRNKFYTAIFFLMPVVSMQMVECYNGNFLYIFSPATFFMNYMAYLLFYVIVFFITSRFRMTIAIVNIVMFVFGLANYYVDLFRGTPLVPMDILAVGTGMNVAAGYDYKLSWQIVMAALMLILIFVMGRQMVNIRPQVRRSKIMVRATAVAYVLIIASTVYGTDVLADHGFKPDFWNQSRGYHSSGIWYNFCLNTKYLHVSAPDGYNSNDVSDLAQDVVDSVDADPDNDTSINLLTGEDTYKASGQKPNVIAIMNETFSDPGTLGDLQTNVDYLPFYHSLTENTIKGTLSVPVFGAGTSNTEYEFLTGNSISTLPSGSSVYESYIDGAQPSLVSTLESQGYSSLALHPYFADGWNRPAVYNDMGFNDFISMEDLIDPNVVAEYKESNDEDAFINQVEALYPDQDNMLLRRFISDSYDFEKVEQLYEQRDTSKPFFLFNVTMQNHGGYDRSYVNFNQEVRITNMMGYYPKAERYLSLLKKSDEALEQLITYFSNVDEPTVIVMFGDHQASVENAFYEELYGKSLDDLTAEEQQTRYQTPFLIWANYDIDEATLNNISANYLSTLLLQVAGLELTPYNEYLAALYQEIPVIDTVGYCGDDGTVYSKDDATSPYADLIHGYDCITYNNLLDTKNRDWSLFTLDGQPMADPPDPDEDGTASDASAGTDADAAAQNDEALPSATS